MHAFRLKAGPRRITAIAHHQAQAATIGEQCWGEHAPVQIVRLSAAKERAMHRDDHPHISLVDLHRPQAQPSPHPLAAPAQAEPTHTVAQLQAEAYQRGLLEGRDGNLGTLLLGMVLGAALILVVLGAYPEVLAWISPAPAIHTFTV